MQTAQVTVEPRWSPAPATAPAAAFDGLPAIGPRLHYGQREEIFGEGEAAEYVYQVIDGVVRTCRFSGDGRRQIEQFLLPGEYFGLELGEEHTTTAEAVDGATVVALLRRSALNELAARDVAVAHRLLDLTMRELRRTQDHLQMLARRGACERVAAFLLDFARRTGAGAVITLPMSRQDIADYLGLTIETVSRTMSQFEAEGVIGLPDRRRVSVRNAARLAAFCD